MKHTKNFAIALFLSLILTNQAFAYEKSGFFMGVQGGFLKQEKTITKSQYEVLIEQRTLGGATTSGEVWNKNTTVGWGMSLDTIDTGIGIGGSSVKIPFNPSFEIGGTIGKIFGGGSSSGGSFSVTADSAIDISVNTNFAKNIEIVSDQPYSIGGVIGYKKIFSSGLNTKQYVGTNLTNHSSGLRYYVAFDISARGKNSNYSSTMVNANIDFLYNLFPDYSYFDFGAFAGVSVGWVRHKTPIYQISGVDYGINFGVRWTFHSRHTIELFGRYGLSTLERRTANSHLESYRNNDLSSVTNNNDTVEVGGQTYEIDTSGSGGKIVVNKKGNSPVQPYYGSDGVVYYQRFDNPTFEPGDDFEETLYVEVGTTYDSSVKVYEKYNKEKHGGQGLVKYAEATLTDSTGTFGYRWTQDAGTDKKTITLTSTQDTYNGGRIETVRDTIQEYRSFPIDTIEEFKNPIKFGIRYTYTF